MKTLDFPYCFLSTAIVGTASAVCNIAILVSRKTFFTDALRVIYSSLACSHILVIAVILARIAMVIFVEGDGRSSAEVILLILVCTVNLACTGNILIISFERFYAVVYYNTYKQFFSNSRRKKMVLIIWAVSFLSGVAFGCVSVFASLPQLVSIGICIVLGCTFILLAATYSFIIVKRRKAGHRAAQNAATSESDKKRQLLAKKDEMRMIILAVSISSSYVFLTAPFAVYNMLFERKTTACDTPQMIFFVASLSLKLMSGLTDPLLYFYTSYRFNKSRRILPGN